TDGLYSLPQTLVMRVPGVTLRSKSANRSGVVLDGRYATGDVVLVQRSDVTIADLTLTRSSWHLVHVVPDGPLSGTLLHNINAVDGAEQFIKVNPAGGHYADEGVIRCSSFEMTDTGRSFVRNNCYTGGIDIHQARGWQVLGNVLNGFWCASGLSEHAIHAWTGSRDTRVEGNVVLNSARGIGFGLGSTVAGRTYADSPCGGAANVGHYGGAIINNFVVANDPRLFASSAGFDTGVGLEQSCETNVLHNTVVSTSTPRSSSVEWRFTNTVATVTNNLASHNLIARDGGQATLSGNVANASLSLFVDAAGGNVHLAAGADAAIDKAVLLSTPVAIDIDGEVRGSPADTGADEYVGPGAATPPADTIAPVITITSPVNGQTVSRTVSIAVAATDNVGVTRTQLYVDGTLTATSTTAPFTMTWNAQRERRGAHTLQVKAFDAAGNSSLSSTVTVYR
ncbi:MAG TPA: Ig-like domain-containing protein, partial [Vicinamibacterales bacterium]